MTGRIIAALLLIILGVVGLTYGRLSFTREEKVLDLGSVEITRDKHESLPIGQIAGGIFIVSGVVLLAMRGKAA
jgi:hypothetical protein